MGLENSTSTGSQERFLLLGFVQKRFSNKVGGWHSSQMYENWGLEQQSRKALETWIWSGVQDLKTDVADELGYSILVSSYPGSRAKIIMPKLYNSQGVLDKLQRRMIDVSLLEIPKTFLY